MSPKRSRTTYQSALTDNACPGGPTTMDVLLHWLTTPGNVKRWRMEPRAPLIREVVDAMQEEGLAHRQPPFVRYKLIAIEKQYITALKWLLETGMHDAYMKGKVAKEVRIHVDHLCPHFKELDPAFRRVPFSKKLAETIDFDEENRNETQEMHEDKKREEEQLLAKKTATPLEKRNTFGDANKEKISTFKQRKKKASRLQKQIAPSPGYAAARKSVTTAELQENIDVDMGQMPTVTIDSVQKTVEIKKNLPKEHLVSSAAKTMKLAVATSKKGASAFAKKQSGRPLVDSSIPTTLNGREIVNGTKEAALKEHAIKQKTSENSTTVVTRKRSPEQVDADKYDINKIERDALLKRVNDEVKQRQEVHLLERAKLECELEAKQVQLLFEKAAARQRLDQLGVQQEEIDRILPL